MPSADSGLRHALIDSNLIASNLIASRAARIFIGQLAEHGQIMLGVNDRRSEFGDKKLDKCMFWFFNIMGDNSGGGSASFSFEG